jgi:acyl-CoA thioester hydrolase
LTSATYRFRCVEADNDRMLAHGHRVIVKIDEAGRPAPWSDWYRETFRRLCDD